MGGSRVKRRICRICRSAVVHARMTYALRKQGHTPKKDCAVLWFNACNVNKTKDLILPESCRPLRQYGRYGTIRLVSPLVTSAPCTADRPGPPFIF